MKKQKDIRILFTSAGRRVELIQAFCNAAEKLGLALKIFGVDISDTAPALYFCDEVRIVCGIDDPEYIPQLLAICEKESVDCLIPTIDTDLILLSENRLKFDACGTKVLIAEPEKVMICQVKNYTHDYFQSLGLKTPELVGFPEEFLRRSDVGEISFPVFIKPRDGSSSIKAYKVENLSELKMYADIIGNYIIQPFIRGREYTVDIFCDFYGNPVYITPRERLAVRSGEVMKTRIVQDERIIEAMKKLVSDFRPCGQITVQLIREDVTGDDYYIEINPRFGGGAPLSIKAGADSAEALLRILNGETLQYVDKAAEDGAVYSRFDQSIRIPEKKRDACCKAVIFDLDDTLFSEKEYVRSGCRVVASMLPQIKNPERKLWDAFLSGKPAIDTVLSEEGIDTGDLAAACLKAYRCHMPEIHLYPEVSEIFAELRRRNVKIGILTDGRPEGQRNKIKALGLKDMVDEIIVTDELGGSIFRKPDDLSFRIMQKRLGVPFASMVYVGDNPKKDFVAPKKLGMRSVWFKNEDGIYDFLDGTGCDYKIDSLDCLIPVLEKWLDF